MQVFRELDQAKKQLELANNEIERLNIAKDRELEDVVRDERLRWKRNFEMMEIKYKGEYEKKLYEQVRGGHEDALHEQMRMELDEARREVLKAHQEKESAQRERDSLKVEIDECRYVMGLLTTEVTDLRVKVSGTINQASRQQAEC